MKIKAIVLIILAAGFTLIAVKCLSQKERPEDTEVWSPVPPKVTPGQGTQPPSDAVVLFDGNSMDAWNIPENTEWTVHDGMVTVTPSMEKKASPVSITSKEAFGDCQLHVEWMAPEEIDSSGQRRGNSGIILQQRYEIQVLDSWENQTYVNGMAGSVYKQHIPLVNACRPPGKWQTYDIIYKAPRFDEEGKLLSPAYVTVIHNGVLIQNHVEIQGSIKHVGQPEYKAHPLEVPLGLQDHGNAVSYRNIWIRKL